jgi:hypothetical protein
MLTPDNFKTILAASRGELRLRSMLLVMLQSFSGTRELCIIGNTMGLKIAKELKEGSNRIELHFPTGRKHSDNPWYTYIGKDACDSLREWFKERGYPTEDNPWIWPSLASRYGKAGGPITESAAMQVFTRVIADLKLRAPVGSGEKHTRYGISIGQVRDLAASLAQRVEGKANDTGDVYTDTTTNYFQGHTLDKLKYRKLHTLDPEYRRRMYELVEPVLSPISNPNFLMTRELIQTQEQVHSLEKQIESRDQSIKQMRKEMDEMPKNMQELVVRFLHENIHIDPSSSIQMIPRKKKRKG